jgi:hypothetical protein
VQRLQADTGFADRAAGIARAMLADDEHDAADGWSIVARAAAGGRSPELDIVEARARNDHWTAFLLGIERLQRMPASGGELLELAMDAQRSGHPGAGFRLLARNWSAVAAESGELATATARRLTTLIGAELTVRIARTEGCQALAGTSLFRRQVDPEWLASMGPGGAGRLELEIGRRPGDGFATAPGVAPLR